MYGTVRRCVVDAPSWKVRARTVQLSPVAVATAVDGESPPFPPPLPKENRKDDKQNTENHTPARLKGIHANEDEQSDVY